MVREYSHNEPNPAGNRKSRRAAYSKRVKLSTFKIANGVPQQVIRGSLTGSNRSRPIKRYKKTWYTPDQYADVIGRWMVGVLDKRIGKIHTGIHV